VSVQALSCAFALRGLSSSEKLVLLALSNFANEQMQCWPSQERLALDTELSARTVWAALKSLEDKGLVSRVTRKRADGTRTTDVFTLHFALQVWAEPLANPANSTRNPCEDQSQPVPQPVAMVATLTTFEPSTDPSSEPKRVDARDLAKTIWEFQPKRDGKRRSTQPDVHRALVSALKRGGEPTEIVNACRGYYALPDSRKQGGEFAMGAAKLLQADRWREFEPAAPPKPMISTPFPDVEIRNAVISAKGEAWAASWLDPCSWEPERRVIVPRNGLAASRLRSEVSRVLQARQVQIQELAA
jgi:hypothetical protein